MWATGMAHARPVVDALPDRAAVDWTRGLVVATGAGTADVRAPSPDIARLGAERAARERAGQRLVAHARALPTADGRTVGERVDADADAAARFARVAAEPITLGVELESDGSATVELALPLESIRLALAPGAVVAGAVGEAPTAIVVDARSVVRAPVVGLTVGGYAGPVVYYRAVKDAGSDARLGARPVRAKATSVDGGDVAVAGELDVTGRPLLVVVIGGGR